MFGNDYIRFGPIVPKRDYTGRKVIHKDDILFPVVIPIIPFLLYLCTGERWSDEVLFPEDLTY